MFASFFGSTKESPNRKKVAGVDLQSESIDSDYGVLQQLPEAQILGRNPSIHRMDTIEEGVINAAENTERDGENNVPTVVQSNADGKVIKFKKAKKLKKSVSKHYMRHLNEISGGRFKHWHRAELVDAIIKKNMELRGESRIETDALRQLCDALYHKQDLPEKAKPIGIFELVFQRIAARKIQNSWIIYQATKRFAKEDAEVAAFNNRANDFDTTGDLQDMGRAELLMMSEAETPTTTDIEAGGSVGGASKTGEGDSLLPKRPKVKKNILDLAWVPPDLNKARIYANYVQPRKGGKGGKKFDFWETTTGRHCCLTGLGEQFDLWNEGQTSEFSAYGAGVTNYFKFMKWAFWTFLLLTIVAIPVMVLNMTGSNNAQGLSAIAQTTIGNLGVSAGGILYYDNSTASYLYNATASVVAEVDVQIPGCSTYGIVQSSTVCHLNSRGLSLFYAIIDIIISAVLFLAYCWLVIFERAEQKVLDDNTVLASQYTVQVSRFPKDTKEEDLTEHFNKLASRKGDGVSQNNHVIDVSFAYDNGEEIDLARARGDIIRRKVHLVHEHRFKCTEIRESTVLKETEKEEKIRKERDLFTTTMKYLNDDLKRKDERLKVLSVAIPTPIKAFVTFNTTTDQKLVLEKYSRFTIKSLLCGSKELTLKGRNLRVVIAPEPSVIIWENIQCTESQRTFRKLLTFFLSLLLIIISLAMVFSSKYLQQRTTNNGSSSGAYCPNNFYDFDDKEQVAIITEYPTLLYCYCQQFNTITQASNTECSNYFTQSSEAQVLAYFASFIVLVVNSLIERLVRLSATFERHHTSDGQSASIFTRLLILKVINTAAVFLINNNNVILKKVFGLTQSSSSVEFTTNWYTTVAVTIVLVQLGDVFSTHILSAYRYFRLEQLKKTARKNLKIALTQDELNRMHVGPEFEFAFNYAQMLSTFFVCLIFSTGIPILYPIAAANFMIFYSMEKYFFIHMYKIPPHFATLVGRRVAGLIPLGILIHLAMSIWVLSNNSLFQSSTSGTDDANGSSGLIHSSVFGTVIQHKITGYATFPLFMCFCAVIGAHVLYYYYKYSKRTIDKMYDFFFGFCSAKYREQMIARRKKKPLANVSFTRAVQRNLIKGLASYNILQNPTYKEAFGITWKFAVEHKGVRDVRNMKAKAQVAEDEDDAVKVEELTRSAVGSPRNLRSPPVKAGKKMAGGLDRNRSFFGAFNDGPPAQSDKGPKRPVASTGPERPSSAPNDHGHHGHGAVTQAPPSVGLPPAVVMGRAVAAPPGAGQYYQQQQNGEHHPPQQGNGGHHHRAPPPGQQQHGYAHPVPHGHPQQYGQPQYGYAQPPAGYGPTQQAAQHRNQYQMAPHNNGGGGGHPNQRRL